MVTTTTGASVTFETFDADVSCIHFMEKVKSPDTTIGFFGLKNFRRLISRWRERPAQQQQVVGSKSEGRGRGFDFRPSCKKVTVLMHGTWHHDKIPNEWKLNGKKIGFDQLKHFFLEMPRIEPGAFGWKV